MTDDEEIFRRRAYPIVEFMLSREKFLFSLDPKQKIQSPSRALLGPCAPVSELATLYGITHGASPILRHLAERMLGKKRTLNLDDVVEGGTWPNQLAVYRETGATEPISIVCGTAEENLANNRALTVRLRAFGADVAWGEVADGHTWTTWRDLLDPHLADLLHRAF